MTKDDRELIELKPCPFCGENMAVMATWISNASDSAEAMEAPVCSCGAQGPMYPTRRLAANAWNIRAATRLEALQAQPVGEAIEHALGFVTQGMGIAYENGLRECGYDPVATLRAALTASPPVVPMRVWNDETKTWDHPSPPVVEREAIARDISRIAGCQVGSERTREGVGELTRLRAALIEAGRNAGCLLADDVSTDFLMHVPEEVRLKLSTPVAQGDEVRDALEILRQAMNALGCTGKNDPLEQIAANGMTVWDGMRAESNRLWPHYEKLLATLTKGARDAG